MDILTIILVASAIIAEEWRQTNRSRPREGYDLDVVVRLRRVRAGSAEDPDADMEQSPELDGDRSELRIFLAEDEADNPLWVRSFPVSGDISTTTTVAEMVMELSSLRHNMVSYDALYPAAVEVRNNLGDEIWDGLEFYRCRVAYLAFSTLRQQDSDTIGFPKGFRDFLDLHIPHMETYMTDRWGQDEGNVFQHIYKDLENIIEIEIQRGIEIHQIWPMKFMMKWFRHQPIFWLVFNLYFPCEERMSWEQVETWAIQWLRKTNMEPPAWPIQLRGLNVWNPDTTVIWNRAVLEVFADVRRRLRSARTILEDA